MKMIRKNKSAIREVVLYIIFGFATTAISFATYYFCLLLMKFNYQVSNVISWCVAVAFAYVTNLRYVFDAKKSLKNGFSFWCLRIITLAIETLLLYVCVDYLGGNPAVIKPIVQIIIIVLNYLIAKFIVFEKSQRS